MKITLAAWAARNYSPAPSIRTLRTWVRTGQVFPPAEKVGRNYMVEETAARLPPMDEPLEAPDLSKLSARALAIWRSA
jgi:predicted site-specific integrase-resolvase